VLAQPSRYEGFGYAAAQALCAGTPCVVSDRGALPEIARGNATVIAVEDVAGWAAALSDAICGGDERAARSRTAAIAQFGWPASARRMAAIYRTALG
jgi:glycosyltransferase involved in cell wall biosynthesis